MGLHCIFVFQNLMNHRQYNPRHRSSEQDCYMLVVGFGLHLHNLQDKFPIHPKHSNHH